MTEPSPSERLAATPKLATIPRAELDWLAAHGETVPLAAGSIAFPKGAPLPGLVIVLSGHLSIRMDRDGVPRIVKELRRGDLSGYLPYSRVVIPTAYAVADEPSEMLVIDRGDVGEMTRECPSFTALCVHEMVDRARLFKSDDLQREKMAALGRLSAGLAHELNNPSSAAARSAKEMNACRVELIAASRALGAAQLTGQALDTLTALEATADKRPKGPYSTLAQADREETIGQWLENHGLGVDLAEPFASTAITVADLEAAHAVLTATQLAVALRYLAATITAGRLTAEIENAATRIHSLVAAVKKHTHMDRAPVVESIQLEGNLTDTLTLIGSKARAKAVTLDLTVEPDLPVVRGIAGELNQAWLNLVDNAIEAAPETGHVAVTAARDGGTVVVTVIDDGAGISEGDRDRIFEPFFTTKGVGQGTGLGLDVVQSIVHSHGGSVQVHSTPGRTEFRVCLPAVGE